MDDDEDTVVVMKAILLREKPIYFDGCEIVYAAMESAIIEIELLRTDSALLKQVLSGLIDRGGIPNWIIDLTSNA